MSIIEKLTEGIVDRDLAKEGAALQSKWEATGLLEGIADDRERASMSRLLENQAKELLREVSTMAAGDVEGFAAVAFPIVRRVFGGLLANDLVSVQPMSLPSGLIFFLDFTYNTARGGLAADDSLYGGGVVASELTGGVTDITEAGGGFYNLANAYSQGTGSLSIDADTSAAGFSNITADDYSTVATAISAFNGSEVQIDALTEAQKTALRYDPDLLAGGPNKLTTDDVVELIVRVSKTEADKMDFRNMGAFDLGTLPNSATLLRRLTHLGTKGTDGVTLSNDNPESSHVAITFYMVGTGITAAGQDATTPLTLSYPFKDSFATADALGGVKGSQFPLELATDTAAEAGSLIDVIPEIDIKVDSIAVTAVTKKLKAKWSPELGQDLNAYHNLDAEVELTSILSEQIALEIDREIVADLIQGATAGTFYWSRSPGLFVNRVTGAELGATSAAPDFTGTVSEWYETLIETINDVSAQIHRKTLRGGANFLVTSPEVANILEFTAGFRANVTHDSDRGTVGAVNVGSISKKFDVYVDPYFPRNVILVGRKGGSFLESGYVYAPYVPLQVTPTIFGVEDFVPRKGVMTRYAKKMVRPDMYGLVICRGLLGESGS